MRPSFSAVSNNLGHLRLEPMTMENQERVNSKLSMKPIYLLQKMRRASKSLTDAAACIPLLCGLCFDQRRTKICAPWGSQLLLPNSFRIHL